MYPNPNGKRGAAYLSISRACSLCKRDHKACNGARPCSRCVSSGLSDKCEDVVLKTRGRPRKKRMVDGSSSYGGDFVFDDVHSPIAPRGGIIATTFTPSSAPSCPNHNGSISFYISSFPSPSVEVLTSTPAAPNKKGGKGSGSVSPVATTTTTTTTVVDQDVSPADQLAMKCKLLQSRLQDLQHKQQAQQPQHQLPVLAPRGILPQQQGQPQQSQGFLPLPPLHSTLYNAFNPVVNQPFNGRAVTPPPSSSSAFSSGPQSPSCRPSSPPSPSTPPSTSTYVFVNIPSNQPPREEEQGGACPMDCKDTGYSHTAEVPPRKTSIAFLCN